MHAQQTPSDLLEAQCRGIARALRIMKQTHFCVLLVKPGNTRMKARQLASQINFLSLHKSEIWRSHAHKELVRRPRAWLTASLGVVHDAAHVMALNVPTGVHFFHTGVQRRKSKLGQTKQ